MNWEVIQGDCLEAMRNIPDGSIDACITDPPYGTTACSWDSVIPFAPMWAALKRVVKKNGAIALFGSQPFTSALVMSNPQMFKYDVVWHKSQARGHLNAQVEPMREHEDILVFGQGRITYNPQLQPKKPENIRPVARIRTNTDCYGSFGEVASRLVPLDVSFPRSVLPANTCNIGEAGYHTNQKPVELMRYLVRTYTNEGDTVLDFTCGSGSTGVACAIENRNFIGIESDPHYVEVSRARIARATGVHAEIPRRQVIEKELPLFSAA